MSQKTISRPTKAELSRVTDIIVRYPAKRASLIPVLQDIQDSFGYLPEAAIDRLSELADISANEIYGVATFYTQFRFSPPGEHTVRV